MLVMQWVKYYYDETEFTPNNFPGFNEGLERAWDERRR